MNDLKTELRAKLEGSSSKNTVDFDVLCQGHQRKRVWEALREMEDEREVYRCLIIKGGVERSVWWSTRTVVAAGRRGIVINTPRKPSLPRPPRMNDLTKALLHKVKTQPGISRMDLLDYGRGQQTTKDTQKVKTALGNLTYKGLIVSSGKRHNLTYTAISA